MFHALNNCIKEMNNWLNVRLIPLSATQGGEALSQMLITAITVPPPHFVTTLQKQPYMVERQKGYVCLPRTWELNQHQAF